MAEGGWLPWKRQKHSQVFADYSNLMKPLPCPPEGLVWTRQNGRDWLLEKTQKENRCSDEESSEPPAFLNHVVMPGDTLLGLTLRYKVSAAELRKANNFFGDHFRLCKILVIPRRSNCGVQKMTQEVMIQYVTAQTSLHAAEARFYLEETDWDKEKAIEQFCKDCDWEESQNAFVPPRPGGVGCPPANEGVSETRRTQAVTGTSGADYIISDAGVVEMICPGEAIMQPLLSANDF
jgi:hypothetical protein